MNAQGEPCGSPEHLVDADGVCATHREGGLDRLRGIASLGGAALKRKHDGGGLDADELPMLVTLEDAKLALDVIRRATLMRRITHGESASASKAVSEWVKTEAAAATARLVGELTKELATKTAEIETLRKQISGRSRTMRVAR